MQTHTQAIDRDCVNLLQNVDVLEYNLTRLRPFTNYSIEMQVVTDDGSGETGPPIFVRTEESGTQAVDSLGGSGLQG